MSLVLVNLLQCMIIWVKLFLLYALFCCLLPRVYGGSRLSNMCMESYVAGYQRVYVW